MPKFVRQGDNLCIGNNTFTGTNTFSGPLVASGGITGDITGNITGNAITVTVADSTDATSSVAIFDSATGNLAPKTDAGLTYNASNGTLTATAFSGPTAGTHTGAVAATTLDASGLTKTPNPVLQQTVTVIDAQNGTPTIAQILGGIITHNSKTGGGTLTVPTGTAMSAGISGVAVGSTIKWTYYNYGNQTVTVTPADGHTLVGGTAAVTTGNHIQCTSYCSAANTWVTFLTTLY
jgi:hypothetical protein